MYCPQCDPKGEKDLNTKDTECAVCGTTLLPAPQPASVQLSPPQIEKAAMLSASHPKSSISSPRRRDTVLQPSRPRPTSAVSSSSNPSRMEARPPRTLASPSRSKQAGSQ